MKERLQSAVAILEELDRRRAEAHDTNLGEDVERDLVDIFIRDLDPEPHVSAGLATRLQSRFAGWMFLIIAGCPYAVILWLMWPRH